MVNYAIDDVFGGLNLDFHIVLGAVAILSHHGCACASLLQSYILCTFCCATASVFVPEPSLWQLLTVVSSTVEKKGTNAHFSFVLFSLRLLALQA